MITLQATSDFIRAHYPVSQTWEAHLLDNWVTWASVKGYLFQVCDQDKLVGLAIARPTGGLKGIIDNNGFQHTPKGQFIFMDLVIANTKPIRQALGLGIVSRFGTRQYVAFRRKGHLKIHDYDRARKALLRTK